MVAVIVAAHGHLAEGLIASSAMIAGPQEDLVAVTFDPSEGPDDLLAKYAAAVEKSSSDHYLILVDLLGGSPYNAAARFAAQREDADVVTGVNLPMLSEVLGRRRVGGTLPELVETARTAGAGGVAAPLVPAVGGDKDAEVPHRRPEGRFDGGRLAAGVEGAPGGPRVGGPGRQQAPPGAAQGPAGRAPPGGGPGPLDDDAHVRPRRQVPGRPGLLVGGYGPGVEVVGERLARAP